MRFFLKISVLFFCMVGKSLANDDVQLLLDSNTRQEQQYRDSAWLNIGEASVESINQSDDFIVLNGQLFKIEHDVNSLELAIYYAINDRQWNKAKRLVERYQQLPKYQPELVWLVEGLAYRQQKQYSKAIQVLEKAFQAAPNNQRVMLELARIYAEDNQNKESMAIFQKILQGDVPDETRQLIQYYLTELDKRHHWHGQVAFSFGHNNNMNQANGASVCAFELANQCLMYQYLSQPISAKVLGYSVVASKVLPIKGNHYLKLRGLSYGNHYTEKDESSVMPDYSNYTNTLYFGYGYSDIRNNLSLLPLFEHEFRNKQTQYRAWGVEGEWNRILNPKWKVSLDSRIKYYRYNGENRKYFSDYYQYDVNLGAEYILSNQAGLFGQLGYSRRKYPSGDSGSREYTAQLGAYYLFHNGNYINTLLIKRRSLYDNVSNFLSAGKRRQDRQTLWLIAVGMRRWNLKGIYPELRWKYNKVNSYSRFYTYKQNELLLSLKYHF